MRYLIHHLLQESAERVGEGVAVDDGSRTVTYAELDRRSDQVANLLRDVGVCPGDRVGLYLAKSIESIIGIYGVLKAGGIYVPLDPQAPPARLAYIARDCDIRVLVSADEKAPAWGDLLGHGAPIASFISLTGDGSASSPLPRTVRAFAMVDVDEQPPGTLSAGRIDQDPAYILYTSGSTGRPKGVTLSHRNGLGFVEWAADAIDATEHDRFSSHAPLHFDLSIFDMFVAAWAGARVVLVPPQASIFPIELSRFIEQRGITVWYSVPSILSALALRGGLEDHPMRSLRAVLFAGEVFPTKYLRRLIELLPGRRFLNLYGPTETNVCTYHEVLQAPDGNDAIPIGRAIANDETFVIADDGSEASPGQVGELHVRGATVMSGYWGDPERTAASLVRDPRGGSDDLVYRTGDLVRQQGDVLDFLGRRDTQVKSRGYRIELGEIETALYAHPQVLECAVTAVPDDLVTNTLRADVVAAGSVDARELISFCSERIPHYMIPDAIAFHDALPKTSTGKVDRQRLLSAT